MWYVYLARCSDFSLYCGITNNLAKRVKAHNKGIGSKYTRSRLPIALVWQEKHPDRSSASKKESKMSRKYSKKWFF